MCAGVAFKVRMRTGSNQDVAAGAAGRNDLAIGIIDCSPPPLLCRESGDLRRLQEGAGHDKYLFKLRMLSVVVGARIKNNDHLRRSSSTRHSRQKRRYT